MDRQNAALQNVLFLITSKGHGRGGHFYSLKTTAEQMASHVNASVLNIGVKPSSVLENIACHKVFLEYRGILGTLSRVLAYVRDTKPDVIHAFDFESFFFARIIAFVMRIPLILTKCGGPNPVRYYPLVESLVLYSAENKAFFESQKRYANTQLYLIPNRVLTPRQNADRIAELEGLIEPGLPVFLRIARISNAYKNSILQTINLVKQLNANGLKVQLLVIGTVQDKEVLEELSCHVAEGMNLVTEGRFTTNASELIDIADFVVGTGRGFMEAALLDKVVLSPNSNLDIPMAPTGKDMDVIASMNFSERPVVSTSSGEAFERIVKILNDEYSRQKAVQFTKKYASDNFLADRIPEKHLSAYQEAHCARLKPLDWIVHGYLTWKAFSCAGRKGVVA